MTEFLRRRIKWRQNQCTAEFTGSAWSLFAWNCRSMKYDDALKELIPLKEPRWELYVDGIELHPNGIADGSFRSEEELKSYIIRNVYDLSDYYLIPSEMLYDAGLVYVTNCWVDGWNLPGSIRVEHRNSLPDKPKQRNINLPTSPEDARATYRKSRGRRKGEPVHDDHRNIPSLVPKFLQQKPQELRRLHKGDDLSLSYQEECEIWIADYVGAGTDEYDTLDDNECYYVLETGECDVQTCAIVTIDPETPIGEEGSSQVQNEGKTNEAEADELHSDDSYRYG